MGDFSEKSRFFTCRGGWTVAHSPNLNSSNSSTVVMRSSRASMANGAWLSVADLSLLARGAMFIGMIVSIVAATRYECHPDRSFSLPQGMKSGVEGLAVCAGYIFGKLIIKMILLISKHQPGQDQLALLDRPPGS